MPRKGTKEWKDWCKKNNACFACGSKDHGIRDCPDNSVNSAAPRNGLNRRPFVGKGRGGGLAVRPRTPATNTLAFRRGDKSRSYKSSRLRAIASCREEDGEEVGDDGEVQIEK